MLLFKPYHIPMILEETKTETRRQWKSARVKVGNLYQCKTTLFGKPFAIVRITGVWKEKLSDISNKSIKAEGYKTLRDFMDVWMKINGSWNPNKIVWVVRFKLEKNLTKNMEVIKC